MKIKAEQTVLVGFTGGLRSSVLATLLQGQGFSVVPVFIDFSDFPHRLWRSVDPALGSSDAARDARARAEALGLELEVLAAGGLFEQKVVDPVVHAALLRRAEEPAVLLHSFLLVPLLDQLARERGCQAWAAGHRITQHGRDLFLDIEPGIESADSSRDQLPLVAFADPRILERGLFPLGAFQDEHLQKLGQQLGIPQSPNVEGSSPTPRHEHPAHHEPELWLEWVSKRLSPEFLERGWAKHPKLPMALVEHVGYFHFPLGTRIRGLDLPDEELEQLFPQGVPSVEARALWVVGFDPVDHTAWVMTRGEFGRGSLLLDELAWWEPQIPADGAPVKVVSFQSGATRAVCVGKVHFHLHSTGRLELRQPCGALFPGTRLVFLRDQRGDSRVVGTARVSSPVPIPGGGRA